jgi:elongator complex protein 3
MLELGATRIELGIQSMDDKVLEFVKRGHSTKESKEAIKLLRDLGFKLNLHYMIFYNTKKEIEDMKKLFSDENYRPDMLKIYPCMIFPGTELHDLYKKEEYKEVTTKEAAEIISEFKRYIQPYCRIQRIQRDIPPKFSSGGVDRSNLRQYVDKLCRRKGIKCKCIRCREVDRVLSKNSSIKIKKIQFRVNHYKASGGDEFFISAEDSGNDIIFGYCRLRFPSQSLKEQITKNSAIIRELHIYSTSVAVGKVSDDSFQHRGIGRKLLNMAEEIAIKHDKNKILIISGVGVREYFRKFGYEKEKTYMVKSLAD